MSVSISNPNLSPVGAPLEALPVAGTGNAMPSLTSLETRPPFIPRGPGNNTPQAKDFPEESVGRLMDPPVAVFRPTHTVAEATEIVRELAASTRVFTYGHIVDDKQVLVGIITMRDLLLHEKTADLASLMLRHPFHLRPDMKLQDAMKLTVNKHFPSYPVCDAEGHLIGVVRGANLFEAQAIEISAQPGTMVGVEKEERVHTPILRSLKFRHPWLQFNLLTAFVSAGVVGLFEDTVQRIVALAVFLPVLMSQSANTGCQALAVGLRGLTLGELKKTDEKRFLFKEAALGLINGALVGITAGIGMFIYATWQHTSASPLALSVVVFFAMTGSCFLSGVSGVFVPLALKKFGADPATASSIFLTTVAEVASMGSFLGLATWWLM